MRAIARVGTGRWAEDTRIIHSVPRRVTTYHVLAGFVKNYATLKKLGKALDAITKGSELLTRLEEGTKKSTEGNLPT